MVPLIGMRFTCTLKTFMKTEMRVIGASPMFSSGGGGACTIICTTPSAGLITRPSRDGVTRAGSRKKQAHQTVSTTPIQPSGAHSQNSTSVPSANRATKRQPSGWSGMRNCSNEDWSCDDTDGLPENLSDYFNCKLPVRQFSANRHHASLALHPTSVGPANAATLRIFPVHRRDAASARHLLYRPCAGRSIGESDPSGVQFPLSLSRDLVRR